MGSNTTNYNLYKPDVGEQDWGLLVNTGFDDIDAQMKVNADGVADNVTAIGLNTTHRTSDGKDHSDVVTNNAKISYTDAAAVGLNTTHRTSNGSDHSFIDQDVTSGAGVTFGSVLIDQDGNSTSLSIDSEATTATVVDIALANTSGNGISIVNTANHASSSLVNLNQQNALSAARVLYINNDGIGIGALISNDNASSSADVISVGNAGTGDGIFIDQNGNGTSLNIDSEATTADVVTINNAGTGVAVSIATGAGGGKGLYIANTGITEALEIYNTGSPTTSHSVLYVNAAGTMNTGDAAAHFKINNGSATKPVILSTNNGQGNALRITQGVATATNTPVFDIYNVTGQTASNSPIARVINAGSGQTQPLMQLYETQAGVATLLDLHTDGDGAHINLSGDPTVASPVDGDFWFDGTSLNMRVGAVTTDLLDAGASGTRATFDDGDLTAGVLTITHSLGLSTPFTLLLTIADNAQKQIIPDEVTFLTNTITVDLTSYGTLTGTWGYYYI